MSPRGPEKPPALTPEESRYLDGQLPPKDARQLEHHLAADPRRSAALDLDREAMDIWRDDVARGSPIAANPAADDDLAERILAGIAAGPASPVPQVPTGGRWYAIAAAALIVVGIAGTAITRADRRQRHEAATGITDLGSMDAQVLEAFVSDRVVWPSEGGR